MANVKFIDNTIKVQNIIDEKATGILHDVAGEVTSQAKRNTKVDTGKTKNSWQYTVDDSTKTAVIGSNYMNAIYEEFGTGEYALQGDGRTGGWFYKDANGNWHHTFGKKPRRPLWNAYTSLKSSIIAKIQEEFRGL